MKYVLKSLRSARIDVRLSFLSNTSRFLFVSFDKALQSNSRWQMYMYLNAFAYQLVS